MKSGIYALYWEEQGLIYIGRAVNFTVRFNRHLNALKNNLHYNHKVQKSYNKYGPPSLLIIEKVPISDLSRLELLWIDEFNSVAEGLNITNGGDGAGYGVNNSASKYSKYCILKIFSLLYRTELSYGHISKKVGVPIHLCKEISSGKVHRWLEEEYPDKYSRMLDMKRLATNNINSMKIVPILVSPEGVEYNSITSIKDFATEHGLNAGNLSSLISGRYKSSKGWTLKNKPAK